MSISLSSSTSESSFAHLPAGASSSSIHHHHHHHQDAVASVLSVLHHTLLWPTSKIAKRLRVPEIIVDESMRVGSSSSVLRAHFSSWAHESNELPDDLPSALVAAAIRQCDAAAGSSSMNNRSGRSESCSTLDDLGNDTGDGLFDEMLDEPHHTSSSPNRSVPLGAGRGVTAAISFDPRLKDHFTFLQQSVGYNFMSILNDPTEVDAKSNNNADWGSWFGGAIQDAFDYGNPTSSRGAFSQGLTSAQMLAQHTGLHSTSAIFQPYLHYVGGVMEKRKSALLEFHRWKDEVQRVQRGGDAAANSSSSSLLDAHRHPWPTDIPAGFFSSEFSVAGLISETLPCDEAATVVASPSPAPPAASSTQPSPPSVTYKTECMTDTLEALEAGCSDLHKSLLRVEHCLFVHVQKRSDDFFAASHSFDELHHDTEDALSNLLKTKEVLITRGDAVVSDYTNVAQLYRRRHHEQLLAHRIGEVLEVVKCWEYVDSWMATEGRSVEMLPEVAQSLMKCQSLMYAANGAGVAPLLGELACARQIPLHVSRAKSALTTMVVGAGSSALGVSLQGLLSGGVIDWAFVTAPLEAAAVLTCLPHVLQQHQQSVLDTLWIWTRQWILASYDAATTASVAKLAVRVPHPKPERAEFLSPLRSWNAATYSRLVTKLLADVQERISSIVTHWNTIREYAADLWLQQNLNSQEQSPHQQQQQDERPHDALPPAFAPGPFESLLSIAAHHCVQDVITVRHEENAAMRMKDLLPLIRQCYLFSHAIDGITGDHQGSRSAGGGGTPPTSSSTSKSHAVATKAFSNVSTKRSANNAKPGGGRSSQLEFRNMLVGQCKNAFIKQHAKLQERVLQAVSTEEQWEPVAAVDSIFQDICTELCRSDDEAVQAFHRLAVDFDCDAELRRHQKNGAFDPSTTGAPSDEGAVVQARKLFVLDPAEAVADSVTDDADNGGVAAAAAGGASSHGFVVSHSILLLLQTLNEYDQLLGHFPFLAFDILQKIYEALKLYDGQCAAMILGASAVDLGILQTISVQHLGLASQCTACLAELTPLLQKRYFRFVPSDKLSAFIEKDFDRACKEFISHRDAFLSKVISVVKENVDKLSKFKPEEWMQKGNYFVMEMLRELARVRKALKPLLRTVDLRSVLIPLIAICTRNLCGVARAIPAEVIKKLEGQVLSDIHLFKLNIEKFGFWTQRCAEVVPALQLLKPQYQPIDVVASCCRPADLKEDETAETVDKFQRFVLGRQ
ncbi:vesicular trafficking protein, Vps54, putative [Bodo saltans]|uniref:Vesicular trafficking protein, Vps54, putative n=1 Tax=Bodo saltans TaxID=75058 RepID=A0A0S4JW41_BODSA|nr:vesicular trafficking protein, Vps54, putative [Bodo saltans]|eukprot:CUG94259.1 vesicular trafficking protein, Vps54, putative [Bodo saltans]